MVLGKGTIKLESLPKITGWGSVGGKKEGEGPLGRNFDMIVPDSYFGEKSWEKAESKFQKTALRLAISRAGISEKSLDVILAGDLLNQCTGAAYSVREFNTPFLGLYGACSTMAEGLILASLLKDGGYARHPAALTSSHFCTAERQFRFPLEYGAQRTPTAQWTATASGAVILGDSEKKNLPRVKSVTIGKICDMKINDLSNMGGAMAPAAADTILNYFKNSGSDISSHDLIVTGDLGAVGSEMLLKILKDEGIDISDRYNDCGLMLYNRKTQNTESGGSGCGCCAGVLTSTLLPGIAEGRYKNILFIATGALMSVTSIQQGETIPAIAHMAEIVGGEA